jgi:uncharacterized membrane protein YdjX (TVP38/TMEM64 family)
MRAALVKFTHLLQRENARTAAMVTAAVVAVAATALLGIFGRDMVDFDALKAWQESVKDTVWAPLAVIAAYVILGLTGFPQFMMHVAAIALFGPAFGLLYAWTGTMISATLHFWLGYVFGAGVFRRFAGDKANRLSSRLARRGIVASALVRIVPSGPFIVVNLAAGVSHIDFRKFALGTAIGTLPKIAFVGFVAAGLNRFVEQQDLLAVGLIVGGLGLWIGLAVLARRRFKDWRAMRETRTTMAEAAEHAGDLPPEGADAARAEAKAG